MSGATYALWYEDLYIHTYAESGEVDWEFWHTNWYLKPGVPEQPYFGHSDFTIDPGWTKDVASNWAEFFDTDEDGDFDTMHRMIEALGFRKVQVYEKYRGSFGVGDSTLCIDTMPFGDFLEIEGSRSAIRKLAQQLGMEWPQRILANYIGIHNLLHQGEGLAFDDITFDNYSDIEIKWERYLPTLTAG